VPGDGLKQLAAMSVVVTSVMPFGRVGHFGTGLCQRHVAWHVDVEMSC